MRIKSTTKTANLPARALLALLLLSGWALPAFGLDPINSSFFSGAIKGYDPVAYFTEGEPVKGSRQFTHTWRGATWRFASREHLELFKADPERYAPQYGGYCAWAVAQGETVGIDPDAWSIIEGKLYLNYSKKIRRQWLEDVEGNIRKGDANWPELLKGR